MAGQADGSEYAIGPGGAITHHGRKAFTLREARSAGATPRRHSCSARRLTPHGARVFPRVNRGVLYGLPVTLEVYSGSY